jgi:hypothetical protein
MSNRTKCVLLVSVYERSHKAGVDHRRCGLRAAHWTLVSFLPYQFTTDDSSTAASASTNFIFALLILKGAAIWLQKKHWASTQLGEKLQCDNFLVGREAAVC